MFTRWALSGRSDTCFPVLYMVPPIYGGKTQNGYVKPAGVLDFNAPLGLEVCTAEEEREKVKGSHSVTGKEQLIKEHAGVFSVHIVQYNDSFK